MQKRVFIVHGWDGLPEHGWYPWLKKELEDRGFIVQVPEMPNAEEPRINKWVSYLKGIVEKVDENTYFVGHSIGCQTIVRYLETLNENEKIGGVVFVAGWLKQLTNLEDDDLVRDVANEWLTTPIDFDKAKSHIKSSIAIFSDNDPFVPLDEQNEFKKVLGSEIIVERQMGHFNEDAGIKELPIALNSLLKIAKGK